jgi:hypothetical protein
VHDLPTDEEKNEGKKKKEREMIVENHALIEKIQPDESILQIYSTKTKYLTVQFIYI